MAIKRNITQLAENSFMLTAFVLRGNLHLMEFYSINDRYG